MGRFIYSILCFSLAALNFCTPAQAEEQNEDVLELTLDGVIKDVLNYNPQVKEARLQWLINSRNFRAAWGDFEPEFVSNYGQNANDRENTVQQKLNLGGRTIFSEDNAQYGVGIEEKMFTGGKSRIGYSVNKLRNNLIISPDNEFSKEYESFVGVTLEQPLLKGAWYGAPTANLRATRKEGYIAFHNYRKQLMVAVSQAESAYWNLVFAQEQYRMAAESVDRAKKIVEDSKERVKVGKMSELDLLEAEAGLADRLSRQAEAEQSRLNAVKQLKLLLSNSQIGSEKKLRAVDELASPKSDEKSGKEEDKEVSLEWILEYQPDYLALQETLEREKILLGSQKAQALPQLNLKGSYGLNGLGDTEQQALDKLKDHNFETWSVGVEMRIPLFMGVRERNELTAQRLKKELAEQKLKATEYEIKSSVDNLTQAIEALKEQIESAEKIVDFKKRLLEVELSRLDEGKSNTRKVYDVEEEFNKAQDRELENKVRYREAVLQLTFMRGTVLRNKGLEDIENKRFVLSRDITDVEKAGGVFPVVRGLPKAQQQPAAESPEPEKEDPESKLGIQEDTMPASALKFNH